MSIVSANVAESHQKGHMCKQFNSNGSPLHFELPHICHKSSLTSSFICDYTRFPNSKHTRTNLMLRKLILRNTFSHRARRTHTSRHHLEHVINIIGT